MEGNQSRHKSNTKTPKHQPVILCGGSGPRLWRLPVVASVPRHKLSNALSQRRVRGKAGECFKGVGVGIGGGHIAGLHGHELLLGLHAQGIFNCRNELGERLGVVVADSIPVVIAGFDHLSAFGRILY